MDIQYLHMLCSGCGSVKVPQGRIVGGNETYEGEVLITLIIFTLLDAHNISTILYEGALDVGHLPARRRQAGVLVRGRAGHGQARHHRRALHHGQEPEEVQIFLAATEIFLPDYP